MHGRHQALDIYDVMPCRPDFGGMNIAANLDYMQICRLCGKFGNYGALDATFRAPCNLGVTIKLIIFLVVLADETQIALIIWAG